jgi:hypothetical protein
MITFTFYVHDTRSNVPTLVFVDAHDEDHSRELAARELMRSEHHVAVDVLRGDHACYRLTRRGERTPNPRFA